MSFIFDALPGIEVPVGSIAHSLAEMWRNNAADGRPAPEADDAKATVWYEKAAQLGHSGAMRNLGAAYRDGKGVKEDAKTAWVWFELAARDLAKNAADHREAVGGQLAEAQLAEAKAAADALGKKIWPDR